MNSKRPKITRAAHPQNPQHQEPPFKIEGYHVSMRRDRAASVCQASVKVQVDGVTNIPSPKATASECAGSGPSLRAREILSVTQKDAPRGLQVRILDSTSGSSARTRVLIESTDGKQDWGTVGVHDNIIEASLQALVDSIEYALMKK